MQNGLDIHTNALAYVPSMPKRAMGGFDSAAADAYVLIADRRDCLVAAAKAGLTIFEDSIVALMMSECSR